MYTRLLTVLALTASLCACSITQKVEPTDLPQQSTLCIVYNSDVREGFLNEFASVLESKGVDYDLVKRGNIPTRCEWTATYTASWSWDMALYMSYAEIKIFKDGRLDGEAIYDSTRGGANMSKFIDAEPKIRELVNQLMQRPSAALFMRRFG